MASRCFESPVSDEPDRRDRRPVGIRNSTISADEGSQGAPPQLSAHDVHTQTPPGSGNAYSREFVREAFTSGRPYSRRTPCY